MDVRLCARQSSRDEIVVSRIYPIDFEEVSDLVEDHMIADIVRALVERESAEQVWGVWVTTSVPAMAKMRLVGVFITHIWREVLFIEDIFTPHACIRCDLEKVNRRPLQSLMGNRKH